MCSSWLTTHPKFFHVKLLSMLLDIRDERAAGGHCGRLSTSARHNTWSLVSCASLASSSAAREAPLGSMGLRRCSSSSCVMCARTEGSKSPGRKLLVHPSFRKVSAVSWVKAGTALTLISQVRSSSSRSFKAGRLCKPASPAAVAIPMLCSSCACSLVSLHTNCMPSSVMHIYCESPGFDQKRLWLTSRLIRSVRCAAIAVSAWDCCCCWLRLSSPRSPRNNSAQRLSAARPRPRPLPCNPS